ncbi:MAG: nucleoside-diphosphate sugar epimerase, partial [Planktothrix sp.]
GEVFNVGSQQEITILDLAQRIIDRVGTTGNNKLSEIQTIPYGQAYAPGFEDMQRRFPDLSKIAEYIGWQPTRSLDEILDDAIESFTTTKDVVVA